MSSSPLLLTNKCVRLKIASLEIRPVLWSERAAAKRWVDPNTWKSWTIWRCHRAVGVGANHSPVWPNYKSTMCQMQYNVTCILIIIQFWRDLHFSWLFLLSCRWFFLCQTYEREQLRDHDGPFSEEVWEHYEQRANPSNTGGWCPVGGTHTGQSG